MNHAAMLSSLVRLDSLQTQLITIAEFLAIPEFVVVTGEHWIGKIDKKNETVFIVAPDNFWIFSDIFRYFSDILSTFHVSGLSNDLPDT